MRHFYCFFVVWMIGCFAPLMGAAPVNQNAIPVNYKLMDQKSFQKLVVGNTVAGVTTNSKSLYLLYFGKDGSCDMWKKNQVFEGSWWVERDEQGRDFMRAFWPSYSSAEATSIWYYVDPQQADTMLVATDKERSPVLLIPGRAFPSQ